MKKLTALAVINQNGKLFVQAAPGEFQVGDELFGVKVYEPSTRSRFAVKERTEKEYRKGVVTGLGKEFVDDHTKQTSVRYYITE